MLASAPEVHSSRVQSLCFDDMDAMASAMNGDTVEFIPIRPGLFDGQLCKIDLDGFNIQRVFHGPLLTHGETRHDRVSLGLAIRPSGGTILNSNVVNPPTLVVISEGATVQGINPGEQDRIKISFRAEAFHRMLDAYGIQAIPRGTHQLLRLREDQAGTLVRAFAAMTDFADNLPNLFAAPGLGNALTEECHRLLAGALSGEEDRPERPRQTRDMLRQVATADAFLHANIDRPIYTDELCAALHVSARTLHQSFAAVYGMSPHAYLKRRRMVLVHRALRSARDGPVLAKSIVLAHGFWHLGRFAHDYAVMFGEMPSETIGNGRRLGTDSRQVATPQRN